MILDDCDLKTRTLIGRMADAGVGDLYFFLLDYIRARTGLDREGSALMAVLSRGRDRRAYTPEDGAMDIVKAVKAHLSRHHNLRILP